MAQPETIVLCGPGADPSDVGKPGKVLAVWTVERGGLEGFLRSPYVHAYMENAVPVVVTFDDPADAAAFRLFVQRGEGTA